MRSPAAQVPSCHLECTGCDAVPAVDGTPTGLPSVDAAAAAAAVNGRGSGGAAGLRPPPPRPTAPSSSSSNNLRSGEGVTAARSTSAADTGVNLEVAPKVAPGATSPMVPSRATSRCSLSHGAVSGRPSSALVRGAMALSGLLSAGRNAVRESHASESAPSSASYR